MKNEMNIKLSEFLEQVSHEDLKQYFRDLGVTPPGDGSKQTLLRFLMESTDYAPVARAALVLELRNSAQKLNATITDTTSKLQDMIDSEKNKRQLLSDELKIQVGGVKALTQTYQVVLGAISAIILLASFTGISKFSEIAKDFAVLDKNSKEATQKLTEVRTMVESYKAHTHRVALADLESIMNSASTRFFLDSDKPLKRIVSSDRKLIEGVRSAPDIGSPRSTSGLTLNDALSLQFEAIDHVINGIDTPKQFTILIKEWESIEEKIKKATFAGNNDEQKRFLAYINNMLGIAHYALYKANHPVYSRANEFEISKSRFEQAIESDRQYSPASSNLAVLLLDKIERSTKTANREQRRNLEIDFNEPEKLLKDALLNDQPPKTTARIYNNLAYSSLQRALMRGESEDYNKALYFVESALQWAELGLAMENPLPILAATKAEIIACKAQIGSFTEASGSAALVNDALEAIKKARQRSFDFEAKSAAELFDKSPSLAKFVERFPQQKNDVLAALNIPI